MAATLPFLAIEVAPQRPAAARPAPAEVCPFRFTGDARAFFGIWIVNLPPSPLTLGIYSAWPKVRTKRYCYGHTLLAGVGFEKLARATQILKGGCSSRRCSSPARWRSSSRRGPSWRSRCSCSRRCRGSWSAA